MPPEQWPGFAANAAGDDPDLQAELLQLLALRSSSFEQALAQVVAPAEAEARTRMPGYRIVRALGSGGMGTVFLAQQQHPVQRLVAVKVIKLGMDSRAVIARFETERQVLAMMASDHIARVFDAGVTEDGRPYFSMEYVDGLPCTAYCAVHRLSLHARIRLLQQACAGVQHAHERGVIHRDLKPGNVLVTSVGGTPCVKVIDFGIARAMAGNEPGATGVPMEGQWLGTREYMSPEQAAAPSDIDVRTDVYALGVIGYELLAGALPEPANLRQRSGSALAATDTAPLCRPSLRASRQPPGANGFLGPAGWSRELRGDLDSILLRALEADRRHRYASPAELAADLERHLHHLPVAAARAGVAYRVRKLVRRHRAKAFATVVAIAAGLLGSILVLAEEARTRTERARRVQAERDRITAGFARLAAVHDKSLWPLALLDRTLDEVDAAVASPALADLGAAERAAWQEDAGGWRRDVQFVRDADELLLEERLGSARAFAIRHQAHIVTALRRYGLDLDCDGGPEWLERARATVEGSRVRDLLLVLVSQARNVTPKTPAVRVLDRALELQRVCYDGVRRDVFTSNWAGRDDDARQALQALAPIITDPLEALVMAPEMERRGLPDLADAMLGRLSLTPSPRTLIAHMLLAWSRRNASGAGAAESGQAPAELEAFLVGLKAHNPDLRIGWVYHARLLAERADPRAGDAFAAALQRFPDAPALLYHLGRWHARQGRREEAVAALERLLRVEPRSAEAYGALRELADDPDRRLALRRQAYVADPWFLESSLPLAQELAERGAWAEVGDIAKQILVGEWRTPAAVGLLRQAAEVAGDHRLAILAHRATAALSHRVATAALARSVLRSGDANVARDLAVAALLQQPADPTERAELWQVVHRACAAAGTPVVAAGGVLEGEALRRHPIASGPFCRLVAATPEGPWDEVVAAFAAPAHPAWETVHRLEHANALLAHGLQTEDGEVIDRAWRAFENLHRDLAEVAARDADAAFAVYLEVQLIQDRQPLRTEIARIRHAQRTQAATLEPLPSRVCERSLALREASRNILLREAVVRADAMR